MLRGSCLYPAFVRAILKPGLPVYKCFFCDKEPVPTYQGLCSGCVGMQRHVRQLERDERMAASERQNHLDALIERIPELIELLKRLK